MTRSDSGGLALPSSSQGGAREAVASPLRVLRLSIKSLPYSSRRSIAKAGLAGLAQIALTA
jgi:hypothetical protein